MENVKQDAMLHQELATYQSDTNSSLPLRNQTRMAGNTLSNMAPSDGAHDAASSVGNNDGNLPDPEEIALDDITVPLEDDEDSDDALTRLDE